MCIKYHKQQAAKQQLPAERQIFGFGTSTDNVLYMYGGIGHTTIFWATIRPICGGPSLPAKYESVGG